MDIKQTASRVIENIARVIVGKDEVIELMLVANYFERNTPARIESRTGVRAVFLPISVTGEPGLDTLFQLYYYWLDTILAAMAETR